MDAIGTSSASDCDPGAPGVAEEFALLPRCLSQSRGEIALADHRRRLEALPQGNVRQIASDG